MYVKLQELSPMGMMREYTIPEVDMNSAPMDIGTFYKNHVSQSLPVVFRKEVSNVEITEALDGKSEDEVNAYL